MPKLSDAQIIQDYLRLFPHTISTELLYSLDGAEFENAVAMLEAATNNGEPINDKIMSPDTPDNVLI